MLQSVTTTQEPTRIAPAGLGYSQPDESRVAVLLNRNARKVTDRVARRVERVVGREHVFYSHSLDEAEALTREIVQRGYGTVICGGGDGTLAGAINMVRSYVSESNAWRQERFERFGEVQDLLRTPRFGFLRLGTGNGMSRVVGARDPMRDLRHVVEYGAGNSHSIPLITDNEDEFFFGGVGYDSLILNDYNSLKARCANGVSKAIMQSVAGYLVAGVGYTAPRVAFGKSPRVEARVVTKGRAYYIDPRRGDALVEVEPGTTLFEGRAGMISAGTSPFYGFGLRMFPFANMMPGMMQLRIATIGPISSVVNLPAVWRGTYRNPKQLFDFMVEDVDVQLASPFPFQHSGDAKGQRDSVRMRTSADPLRLVDYYPRLPHA